MTRGKQPPLLGHPHSEGLVAQIEAHPVGRLKEEARRLEEAGSQGVGQVGRESDSWDRRLTRWFEEA